PFLAAPCTLMLGRPRLAWLFACLVSALTFAVSISLLLQVQDSGVLIYTLGGWDAPWGIEYRIDSLNVMLLMLVSGMSSVVLVAAQRSIEREIGESRQTLF